MPAQPHSSSAANPLEQLKDIHLPDAVSWWPPAPGWWFLAALVIVAVWLSMAFFLRRRQKNRYRQSALHELKHLSAGSEQDIIILLRRTALTAQVANAASDQSVQQFLRSLRDNSGACYFEQALSERLQQQLYQANPAPLSDSEYLQLTTAAATWIKKHQRGRHVG